jgi:RNA polymerase sigma-70 factor (ECF subfamily)
MEHIGEDRTVAVEAVVRAEYVRLVRAVALSCGSLPAAEDAVQEAFARAWERTRRGEDLHHLAGWVVTVALNLTRNRFRQLRREVPLDERAEVAIENDPSLIDLGRAVDGLPRRQREVVVLHYYLGYEVRLNAELLRVSEGNVKNALHRARASLARALQMEGEEVADRD